MVSDPRESGPGFKGLGVEKPEEVVPKAEKLEEVGSKEAVLVEKESGIVEPGAGELGEEMPIVEEPKEEAPGFWSTY